MKIDSLNLLYEITDQLRELRSKMIDAIDRLDPSIYSNERNANSIDDLVHETDVLDEIIISIAESSKTFRKGVLERQ